MKTAYTVPCESVREIVDFINKNELQPQDIVQIIQDANYYRLIYFK